MHRLAKMLLLSLLAAPAVAVAAEPPDPAAFAGRVQPFFEKYCYTCHGMDKQKAGLGLHNFNAPTDILKHRKTFDAVFDALVHSDMPPEEKPQPTPDERNFVADWIKAQLNSLDCTQGPTDPGRVTIRRLNRVEYSNTIRDLLGVRYEVGNEFPADDVGYGFDNIGDVLSMPPVLMERYLAAAQQIADMAIVAGKPDHETTNRIITARPNDKQTWEQAAARVLEPLASRAFRRPVTAEELKGLVGLTTLARENNDTYEAGIQIALQAMLISPHFLFRVELDQYPDDPTIPHLINEYELATRLSYFLWSTMPDDELRAEAKAGTLRKNLDKQVRRMLVHDKAEALVENFASQWLQLRMLDSVNPDRRTFRDWEDSLRRSMRRETEEFFEYIMQEDLSVLTLLDADFTFVNEELAKLYGMEVEGLSRREFRKVEYPDNNRGGILTHASVLTVTSNPTRTSAVKRGKYILENLLGEPPPPPPPEAGELPENAEKLEGTIREQFEQHRADPACANCHAKMDPLGFAFENFDGIGRWRTQERSGATIDASGVLEGQKFNGPAELREILLEQKDQFVRTMTEKMLTYALGRGLEYYDECAVQDITKAMAANDYRFSTLVLGIVKSEPFQMRRARKDG